MNETFTDDQKRSIIEEAFKGNFNEVADKYGLSSQQIYMWKNKLEIIDKIQDDPEKKEAPSPSKKRGRPSGSRTKKSNSKVNPDNQENINLKAKVKELNNFNKILKEENAYLKEIAGKLLIDQKLREKEDYEIPF